MLLKGLQITAGFTLGLLAWDKKDRATAAKRYKEALDLAATYPPFNSVARSKKHLERWVATEVQTTKDNLDMLIKNDAANAEHLRELGIEGGSLRKEVVELPNLRIEDNGALNPQHSFVTATDACHKCGKRDVKLQRCGGCKKVPYCSPECQVSLGLSSDGPSILIIGLLNSRCHPEGGLAVSSSTPIF